jgi:hypothetical protein
MYTKPKLLGNKALGQISNADLLGQIDAYEKISAIMRELDGDEKNLWDELAQELEDERTYRIQLLSRYN